MNLASAPAAKTSRLHEEHPILQVVDLAHERTLSPMQVSRAFLRLANRRSSSTESALAPSLVIQQAKGSLARLIQSQWSRS